jgi:hypothetical protein
LSHGCSGFFSLFLAADLFLLILSHGALLILFWSDGLFGWVNVKNQLLQPIFFLQVSFGLLVFRIGERPRFLFLKHERPRIDRPRNIGEAKKNSPTINESYKAYFNFQTINLFFTKNIFFKKMNRERLNTLCSKQYMAAK